MTARALKLLKLTLLALPFALLAALAWTLGSNAGLHFLVARADAAVGGGLSVGAMEGALARGFVLHDVVLMLGETRIEVRRLQGELRPAPLLVGKLTLVALELDGVGVVVPVDEAPEPFTLPPRIELPVHVAIERFAVRELSVAVGATPPVELATISGRASADARGLRVEDAHLAGRGLVADGSLAMALAQPYATAGALRLKLERADLPPIAGNAQLSGRLEALRLAAALDAPIAARIELALDDPFGTKRIAGRIEARDADLAPLVAALTGWRFDADLGLGGTLAAPTLAGTVAARGADLPALRAELDARLAGEVVQLRRLTLTAAGRRTRLDARGRMTLDGRDLPFALEAEATDPALPTLAMTLVGDLVRAEGRLAAQDRGGVLDAALGVEARAARATLTATLAAWPLPGGGVLDAERLQASLAAGRVDFAATGSAIQGKQRASYDLSGSADAERLTLGSIELGLLGGRAVGDGSLELGGMRRWQATLLASDIDPKGLDPRFPGRLGGRLELGGSVEQPTLALSDLAGELRGRKLAGHAKLRHGRSAELVALGLPAWVLDALELQAGGARLAAQAGDASARLELTAPDLADLLPNARGALELHASRDGGALEVLGSAQGVQVGAVRLATLDLALAAPADGTVSGRLAAAGLSAGDIALDALTLTASGTRSALAFGLEAERTGTRFVAAADGALDAGRYTGQLTRWELAPVGAPRWTLEHAAPLTLGRDGVAAGQACVGDGKARACVDGGWHPLAPWQGTIAVTGLGLGAFHAWLPRRLVYTGELDLEARVAGTGPVLGAVRGELKLSGGSVDATVRRGKTSTATRLIEFSGGRVLLERDPRRIGLGVALALSGGGKLDAELEATGDGEFGARALSGKVVARVEQFALLPVLLPEVKQIAGRLDADLAVGGTVDAPRFSGQASLRGDSASVPRYGLELSAFELAISGDGDALDLKGSARAGGTLEWQAKLRHDATGWSAKGWLRGDRFRALNTPEARVIASPELELDYAADRLSVTGTVLVPEARIAPRSLTSAVQASSDEVLVGDATAAADADALAVEARVRVALGDAVEFEGFGLKAEVEGGLTLTEKPGSLTLASGELALVGGKYEAYGQQLTIRRGKLLFTGGPVADPGLDVRAERLVDRVDADDITVGIDVRGTLRQPELALFSEPPMSSSEQLAYLVLGRSLDESTEGDQQLLGDATQSMKLSGGELIAQQIGMRIGLDEVRIEDDGEQAEAQLWLGTYLSPRLFVSYGIGLFEDFYSARVRYDISAKWSVEAESGRESSADFKYTIER